MKLTKIHLFLILLLSLIFCCCLGRPSYYEGMSSARTVTGPQGNSATVYTGPQGNKAVTTSSGGSSSSYDANTYTGPQGNQATVYTGPQGNTAVTTSDGTSSSSTYNANTYTGPQGNQATVVTGPDGQAVVATTENTVYGISSSQIPAGQEDLYILKSQVVPPVCPACPSAASCPRQKPCQPCPPCARCPEPAFECKKVPNYSSSNDQFLPRPVLADFSTFGS